ncbi:hypothetical protein HID58_038319, partial [Brassica napus]
VEVTEIGGGVSENTVRDGAGERDAGRRRAVTLLLSHFTPAQLHGEVCLMSQQNVRPPTEERRERRAALSALRSWVEGRGRESRRVVRRTERIVMEELGKTRIVR